jgi:hypothetical protein
LPRAPGRHPMLPGVPLFLRRHQTCPPSYQHNERTGSINGMLCRHRQCVPQRPRPRLAHGSCVTFSTLRMSITPCSEIRMRWWGLIDGD